MNGEVSEGTFCLTTCNLIYVLEEAFPWMKHPLYTSLFVYLRLYVPAADI